MIPFLDLGAAFSELSSEIDAAVARVLRSGWYIGGAEVEAFESRYADYVGAGFCVGVGNGLDALILALRACEIGPGDEVIVPSNTFVATWLAVSAVGATPVPVEPGPGSFNMDPTLIEHAITDRTRAIIPVHLYGHPADLDPILAVARRHNLLVIEDAAQAHGARYKGQRIGKHGDVVCWSFYPGKNLGAVGDAGAITTDNEDVARAVRRLGNYGSDKKYVNEVRGTNSRMDPVQAAVLGVKLQRLDEWNARRKTLASAYLDGLRGCDLVLPEISPWADPVWHLFVIRNNDRDRLQAKLKSAGVETLIHYPIPPHLQTAYSDLEISQGQLPIAEKLAAEVLSLPIGPHMSAEDLQSVIRNIALVA